MQEWKIVLVSVLIGIIVSNIWFWNFNYAKDVKSNYDLGFLYGREIGYNEGNRSGYESGFNNGNFSGYHQGYQIGYAEGNQSGYIIGNGTGYQLGYEDGYHLGYQLGYSTGYQLGYSNGSDTGYSLGFYYGNISGFSDGYLKGVIDGAGTGYNIRNPTYQEMVNFIAADKTDENEYSENYTCLHFTADVKNNAFKSGYRCGFVYIEFPDSAHAIICFNTTDYGLIFIEPQNDEAATLTIGQPYWNRSIYPPPGYNDTIVSFVIIW